MSIPKYNNELKFTTFPFNNSHYFFIFANLVQFSKESTICKSMTKFAAF
jgi:hypothetical protein